MKTAALLKITINYNKYYEGNQASLVAQMVVSVYNAGDLGSIPRLGRSPGEGKGYPLQYSGLENFMDSIYSPWSCKESDRTE